MSVTHNIPSEERRHERTRIRLREVTLYDVDGPYLQWMKDPDVTRYLETRFDVMTHEKLAAYVRTLIGDPRNHFLAILRKMDDWHIGNVKIGPIDWNHGTAEVGIIIGDRSVWGQGYATEAIQCVTAYAYEILGLRKLTAGCYAPNIGSLRAFKKAGFKVEGTRANQFRLGNGYVDHILLGHLREIHGKQN